MGRRAHENDPLPEAKGSPCLMGEPCTRSREGESRARSNALLLREGEEHAAGLMTTFIDCLQVCLHRCQMTSHELFRLQWLGKRSFKTSMGNRKQLTADLITVSLELCEGNPQE